MRFAKLAAITLSLVAAFSTFADGPTIRRDVEVSAPIERVWHAWTTNEGARAFFSDWTNIELRPGGPYEVFFAAEGDVPAGQRGCEGCRVLAFDPPHMLSFTWNSPPKFGNLRPHQTHVTIRLEEKGADRTIVHFVHEGFGESETWLQIHQYFERAWGERVLPNLVKSFE